MEQSGWEWNGELKWQTPGSRKFQFSDLLLVLVNWKCNQVIIFYFFATVSRCSRKHSCNLSGFSLSKHFPSKCRRCNSCPSISSSPSSRDLNSPSRWDGDSHIQTSNHLYCIWCSRYNLLYTSSLITISILPLPPWLLVSHSLLTKIYLYLPALAMSLFLISLYRISPLYTCSPVIGL